MSHDVRLYKFHCIMFFVFFQSLGGLFPDMKSETADVIQEINTYFTGLHGILQAREKQLTREVYDAFKAGVEPLYNLVNIVFITMLERNKEN